ncbi:hypothetical protein EJ06DRAFT_475959 [Trichodelitschia bisporula]|uniref:Zn(2)-C6 fungal-type domain-containing protein n=1 Tax=Trichodelitschia bisporula TaxID=703511 RepID=A0A6G1I0B1_9PEZI|nr:hypothetical protein EJ06DRAFT_475959 [Trichodelitschia bisporula]
MPESADSAKEDYFNDLSQPLEDAERSVGANEGQPKTKRIACILCRKRKLRCDGCRPTCGTCKRLSHDCTYDEVRKKSGPKRGYVKLLEARLQQVETLLKSQEPESSSVLATARAPVENAFASRPVENTFSPTVPTDMGMGREALSQQDFVLLDAPAETVAEDPFSWEVVGMGLEESLPPQDTINELNEVYFQKIHPAIPMIHRGRFLASMSLAPHMRPPISLRYAVWCHAASLTDRYESLTDTFYQRARKYLHNDEMKRHGESLLNVGYCQAWLLVSMHEFRNMYFPRAWMSVGRSVRLAQMLGLQRLDGVGLDVKQCLQPAKDWIEAEERRRTFWIAFCQDRYASVGTGWPMTIDETDIMTNLPAPDASFESGTPVPLISLEQALKPTGAAQLHSTSGVIIMAVLLGRNLLHLHRPSKANDDHDLNGEFWQRHRDLEGILAHTALSMPDSMRLPAGLPNPSTIFTNMLMHTSAICLHQAAIFKADKHRLPANVASESRVRCVTAAAEIARIMRMISHLDLGNMHPFMTFSLYVANRVFIQYLKFRPNDGQMMSSLQFLLAAMNALKRRNPLSESFIAQLDVDLEVSGFGESVRYMTKTSLVRPPLPTPPHP